MKRAHVFAVVALAASAVLAGVALAMFARDPFGLAFLAPGVAAVVADFVAILNA